MGNVVCTAWTETPSGNRGIVLTGESTMRHVFSNGECVHVWAQRVQDYGRGSSIFFEKDVIYSYGHHFPMARHLDDHTVLYTTDTYSPTTGQHLSMVRSAIRHKTVIQAERIDIDPRYPDSNKSAHLQNIGRFYGHIDDFMVKAKRARFTKAWNTRDAIAEIENAQRYIAWFKVKSLLNRPQRRMIYDIVDGLRESLPALEVQDAEKKAISDARYHEKWLQKQAEQERRAMEQAKQDEERLTKWKGRPLTCENRPGLAFLRLSEDGSRIETSMHAQILTVHAPALWRIIQHVRESGQEYTEPLKIDYYTLRKIDAAGDMWIGCHHIPYSELLDIAQELNLTE